MKCWEREQQGMSIKVLIWFNLGTHLETNEAVAVKAIDMSQVNNEVTRYLLDGEKKAMTTINNPYVIKTHNIIQ